MSTELGQDQSVEAIIWEVAAGALVLGVDVILDFGCWVRSQRDELRARARTVGADFKIHFADVPKEVLFARLQARNGLHAEGTFFIPAEKLKEWLLIFEPPSSEELHS